MTEPDRALADVGVLVEERRRYEGWLAALESRRDRTPEHIYERVESDYRSRLQMVNEQLASHRTVLQEERGSVESRLSLIAAEAKMRGDEKAELELRYEVGEVPAGEIAGALQSLTRTLDQLKTERQNLERRKAEIAKLLAGHSGEGSQPPSVSELPPAPVAPNAQPVQDTAPPPHEESPKGEAKFVPASRPTPISPHPPIGLRPSAATEQTKTLKCAECGGMNYPTEWYCERCGAELAAL